MEVQARESTAVLVYPKCGMRVDAALRIKPKGRQRPGDTQEEKSKKRPYHIDEDHSCWLHAVGHGDGDEPAQRDEAPEEAGQVTGHFVYHRERLFHRVAVDEARVLSLRENENSTSH